MTSGNVVDRNAVVGFAHGRPPSARVIATEPESNTGTNFKITAVDQIRPTATTTTTIVATHSRILHPLSLISSGELANRPRYRRRIQHHGNQLAHGGERPHQAHRDHDTHCPCEHLHPLR